MSIRPPPSFTPLSASRYALACSNGIPRAIASIITIAVRSAKHNINQGITAPGLAGAVEATALLFTTEGHKQRVDAFLK